MAGLILYVGQKSCDLGPRDFEIHVLFFVKIAGSGYMRGISLVKVACTDVRAHIMISYLNLFIQSMAWSPPLNTVNDQKSHV